MDLIFATKYITKKLKESTSEVFHKWNRKKEVIYPYLTYQLEHEPSDEIRDVFELTLDLFDNSKSNKKLLELENKLIQSLHRNHEVLDDAIVSIKLERSTDIPTADEAILRKNIMFKIKIDWRKLNG